MKLNRSKLPFTDFINKNKIISTCINIASKIIFSLIRFVLKPFSYSISDLVVISMHRLGDTIFTIPAIRELHKIYGNKIVILCFQESIPIYRLEFGDLRFCPVEHTEFYFGQRIATRSAKYKLNALKPGIVLDLTGSMTSASLIYNCRASKIYGINRNQFKSIYDHFVPVREVPKLVDIYLDAISGFPEVNNKIQVRINNISLNLDGKILIHPFAGWKEKEWGLKKFIKLAEVLQKNYSVSIICPSGYIASDVLIEINKSDIEVMSTTSIEELINVIGECSLFIGNDSGPVNIANYLGKPTYSIYGATNPDFTASTETYQIFSQKILKCSAQMNEKYCAIGIGVFDCSGNQCMKLLTVEEVYNALQPLLNSYCSKK